MMLRGKAIRKIHREPFLGLVRAWAPVFSLAAVSLRARRSLQHQGRSSSVSTLCSATAMIEFSRLSMFEESSSLLTPLIQCSYLASERTRTEVFGADVEPCRCLCINL